MGLIDYTGKLNTHEDCLKVIEKLEKVCQYVEIVVIDERETDELVERLREYETFCKYFFSDEEIEEIEITEKELEEFFAGLDDADYDAEEEAADETDEDEVDIFIGDRSETTDFGYDDIAFYDKDNRCLLNTTTHEGYIMIDDDLAD